MALRCTQVVAFGDVYVIWSVSMFPGIYTRTVLPDEIDEDPVEPEPDEGLVERVAALLSVQGGASFPWAELRPDTKGIWLNRARAVLAEIASEASDGALVWPGWTARATQAEQRVAELEAELADEILSSNSLRSSAEALSSDLATVTRERDELASRHGVDCVNAQRRIDSLTRELAEAKALANKRGDMVCDYERLLREKKLETHALSGKLAEAKRHQDHVSKVSDARSRCLDRLTRELAEAKRDEHSACERGNRLAQELAEAREELRLLVPIADAARDVCSEAVWARGRSLVAAYDAHRAKTSGAAGDGTCTPVESAAPELPYETAPRLTKGVRYRVVESTVGVSGDEFVASGLECVLPAKGGSWGPGWYLNPDAPGYHRVVRVEPEKAIKCDQDDCPGHATAEERPCRWEPGVSKEPDNGPPRVGDVVRWAKDDSERKVSHTAGSIGKAVWFEGGHGGWVPYDMVTVIRRASQPEAKAVLPIDSEDERVVDALVRRKTADRAERPLYGPHTETVADLVRRVERLECMVGGQGSETLDAFKEIRAERAGRK